MPKLNIMKKLDEDFESDPLLKLLKSEVVKSRSMAEKLKSELKELINILKAAGKDTSQVEKQQKILNEEVRQIEKEEKKTQEEYKMNQERIVEAITMMKELEAKLKSMRDQMEKEHKAEYEAAMLVLLEEMKRKLEMLKVQLSGLEAELEELNRSIHESVIRTSKMLSEMVEKYDLKKYMTPEDLGQYREDQRELEELKSRKQQGEDVDDEIHEINRRDAEILNRAKGKLPEDKLKELNVEFAALEAVLNDVNTKKDRKKIIRAAMRDVEEKMHIIEETFKNPKVGIVKDVVANKKQATQELPQKQTQQQTKQESEDELANQSNRPSLTHSMNPGRRR